MSDDLRPNTIASKPNFVKIEVFYDTLKRYMDLLSEGNIQNNVNKKHIALVSIHQLFAPYIKQKYNQELLDDIKEIEKFIQIKNFAAQVKTNKLLSNLTYKLNEYGKHLLLPQNLDESVEDIDWEKAMR